jgi:eukaryotic-like serine/threonine-protein kinase
MDRERWREIEQLYESALRQEPAERASFLTASCHGDTELQREVALLLQTPASRDGESRGSRFAENRTILQYQILEQIGAGGMGVVYKARDLKLDRLVALKFLSSDLLDSMNARMRFKREAHALSALNHPNIATIFDVEEFENEPFLVLEYLPGGTLHSKVRRLASEGTRLSIEQVFEYAVQIGEGLAYAHRHEIVHRDVKSGNVLFSAEGRLKITDFGLAKFRGSAPETNPGHAMGTVAYMSPEQARGEEADHRSDIFSFGIVLYELAAGELPFRAEHAEGVAYQIVHVSPRPLRELRPEVPCEFETLLQRTLAKDPKDRPQRMEEVVTGLRQLAAPGTPRTVSAAPTFTVAPAARRRSPRRSLLVLALMVAIVGGLTAALPGVRKPLVRLFSHSSVETGKHLAVIPFANVGDNAPDQAFCDGVMQSLTSSLTQIERFQGSLLVVPASEVVRQSITSASDARRAFGVNLAVTGSVQRIGTAVRLTVNLVDAQTLRQLGARSIDVSRENLEAMEDRLVEFAAELLDLQLQPQARMTLGAGKTSIPDAFDLYTHGRGYLHRFDKPGNVGRAIDAFQQAIQKDPRYALAYAGLGEAYWRNFERTKDVQWLELAQDADAHAIEIGDRFAGVHVNLGMIYAATGRNEQALVEFKRALDLDPLSVDAYRELGNTYEAMNRIQDAEVTYQRAIQLRPGDWLSNGNLGAFYYRHGRYADAEPLFRKQIDLTPDNFIGYSNLGGLYILLGRDAEAEALLKKSVSVKPTDRAYSNLGTLYYQRGSYSDAVAMYEKAVALGAGNYVLFGNLADSYLRTPDLVHKAEATYRKAIDLAEQQLAINPKNAASWSRLARYRVRIGESEKALTDIHRARQLAPTDTTVGFNALLVYERAGHRSEAIRTLDELLKGNYPLDQVEREPELEQFRQDPRYRRAANLYADKHSRPKSR